MEHEITNSILTRYRGYNGLKGYLYLTKDRLSFSDANTTKVYY
ncbi:hypothetical protein [Desertivirga arenae]|nr:hypothetical protein [Pedobacter sp. SYSU D00823]